MSEYTSINSQIIETVIGVQTKFKGNVKTDKPFRIDGIFEGDIVSSDTVIVSETGTFSGTITCNKLTLVGRGEGTVASAQLVDVKPGAVFKGEINVKTILMTEGSVIEGPVYMLKMQ